MNILFLPNDSGGGFGHVARSLAVAKDAARRNHKCAFLLSTTKYRSKIPGDMTVFIAPIITKWKTSSNRLLRMMAGSSPEEQPIFVQISGTGYQAIRDGLLDEKTALRLIRLYMKIVEGFKPHIIIGDGNLLAGILAKMIKIPVVQIVQSVYHPDNGKLIWWKENNQEMHPPEIGFVFNALLEKAGLEAITRAEELFRGDLYVIPSIPELDPIADDHNSIYVGSLTSNQEIEEKTEWSGVIDSDEPLIYVTVGGGAGSANNRMLFSTISEAFRHQPFRVIVSTGLRENSTKLPSSDNVRFFQWVSGKDLMSRAELVIFHGGHGTMLECLGQGKPTLVLPFQTEQEGNGRRLAQLNCGRVVRLSREDYKAVTRTWLYGRYSFLVQNRYDLTAGELLAAVTEIFTNTGYRSSAQALKARVEQFRGAAAAVEAVVSLS